MRMGRPSFQELPGLLALRAPWLMVQLSSPTPGLADHSLASFLCVFLPPTKVVSIVILSSLLFAKYSHRCYSDALSLFASCFRSGLASQVQS